MKHKNRIYIPLLALAIVMISASCGENFLYKPAQNNITREALTNQTGIDLLVVNVYANLTENGWGATPFNWTFGGMYGGDANKGSDPNDQAVLNEMETYKTLPTNSYITQKYLWVYKGVKRVNVPLQMIVEDEERNDDEQVLSSEFRTLRRGELLFMRALFYFEGIKVFGPMLPWVDETIYENDPKVHNDIDIYPKVLADLDAAIAALPDQQAQVGRPNSWAAKALKAKVLMQQGNMVAAKPILQDVITNGKTSNGLAYGLEDDLTANFNSFRDNGKESIFAVQFSSDYNNGNTGMSICYPYGGDGAPGGCCGFYQPSNELANSYKVGADGLPLLDNSYRNAPYVDNPVFGEDAPLSEVNMAVTVDPRIDFAIGRFGVPYKDWGLPKNNWVRSSINGGFYMSKKHVYTVEERDAGVASGSQSDGWAPGSAINLQYLSLRDMILLYAECLANDDQLSDAMAMVNQIRARAALPVNIVKINNVPAANYSIAQYPNTHAAFSDKETCIKAIRMERKLELAMEGQRWFDLARWGGQYMSQQLSDYIDFERDFIAKFASASVLPANKTMFPLPQSQIQTMGNDESGQPYLVQPTPWQ